MAISQAYKECQIACETIANPQDLNSVRNAYIKKVEHSIQTEIDIIESEFISIPKTLNAARDDYVKKINTFVRATIEKMPTGCMEEVLNRRALYIALADKIDVGEKNAD